MKQPEACRPLCREMNHTQIYRAVIRLESVIPWISYRQMKHASSFGTKCAFKINRVGLSGCMLLISCNRVHEFLNLLFSLCPSNSACFCDLFSEVHVVVNVLTSYVN